MSHPKKAYLSEFGVTNETKNGYRNFICSACYAILHTIQVYMGAVFINTN